MFVANNGSLVLSGVTSDESGRYSCHVYNEFTSDTADIILEEADLTGNYEIVKKQLPTLRVLDWNWT